MGSVSQVAAQYRPNTMRVPAVAVLFLSVVSCDISAIGGAIDKLDKQMRFLIQSIEGSVDQVISGLRSDCERSRLQTQTYGWALIAGGALDIAAEQIGKNIDDALTMPAVTYSYGYYAGYAMGFAGPYLLPTYIGSCSYDCSSTDFNTIVNKYNFRNGISGQNIGASKIQSFGIDAKQALSCITQQSGDSKEAASVSYSIDDIVDAGLQIVSLQNKI